SPLIAGLLLRQVLSKEGVDLGPAIHRLFDAIHRRPVPIEEAVAGAVVAVEFIVFAVLLELGFVLVHLLRARRAIVVAEEAEQRAGEVLRHVDWRDRLFLVEVRLGHHHVAAPLLDAGIDVLALAGVDESVPAARARPHHTDLAVVIGLRAHPRHGAGGIAHHLGIGDAALSTNLGADVVRIGVTAAAFARVEIGANREIAGMSEAARLVDVIFAPARREVNQHDARKGPRTGRFRHVSRYRRSLVACDGHSLAGHASVERHRFFSMGIGPLLAHFRLCPRLAHSARWAFPAASARARRRCTAAIWRLYEAEPRKSSIGSIASCTKDAASRKVFSSGVLPASAASTAVACTGTVAAAPSATRACAIVPLESSAKRTA